jgi:hypothetical protein
VSYGLTRTPARGENLTEVPLEGPAFACCVGECCLLRTNVDAFRGESPPPAATERVRCDHSQCLLRGRPWPAAGDGCHPDAQEQLAGPLCGRRTVRDMPRTGGWAGWTSMLQSRIDNTRILFVIDNQCSYCLSTIRTIKVMRPTHAVLPAGRARTCRSLRSAAAGPERLQPPWP